MAVGRSGIEIFSWNEKILPINVSLFTLEERGRSASQGA